MKGYKKWSAFALMVGMAILFSSCVVHRLPHRPHYHHHRHKIVVIAEQATVTEQNKDCITCEASLAIAITKPDSYGNNE